MNDIFNFDDDKNKKLNADDILNNFINNNNMNKGLPPFGRPDVKFSSEMICPWRPLVMTEVSNDEETHKSITKNWMEYQKCYLNNCPWFIEGCCGKVALSFTSEYMGDY